MAAGGRYLVVFYVATAPKVGDEFGIEEREIVLVAWVVVDLVELKVCKPTVRYVVEAPNSLPPAEFVAEAKLTDQDPVVLTVVFEEFIKFVNDQHLVVDGVPDFTLITDGQHPLRQYLHPESVYKNIDEFLPECFYRFYDLRKEYGKIINQTADVRTSISDMARILGISTEGASNNGTDECLIMAQIILRLATEHHHEFKEAEIIQPALETGPCVQNDNIDSETIVKARGLPWQSSDQEVARFFRGLNVSKGGVALCLNPQVRLLFGGLFSEWKTLEELTYCMLDNPKGRRNGEAIIRFTSREHREMSLQRHKHHLGHRYIEVYKATSEDYLKVAGDANHEAMMFLGKPDAQVIIRLRGLPFSATSENIIDFFHQSGLTVAYGKEGILFVKYPDKRATGDAFVLFKTEKEAKAAQAKHKDNMKDRYIEVFRSTGAEVTQVLKRYASTPLIPSGPPSLTTTHNFPTQLAAMAAAGLIPGLVPMAPQVMIRPRDCIRLSNLPLNTKAEDITLFLGTYAEHIKPQGIHMVLNQKGLPSGEAFIQMMSDTVAKQACLDCNKKLIHELQVQVLQSSEQEMNALMGGTMPKAMLTPQTMTYMPFGYMPSPPISPSSVMYCNQPNYGLVRIKNLPLNCSFADIASYFPGYHIPEGCIQFLLNGYGKQNGEAIITFLTPAIARQVIEEKERGYMPNKQLELCLV